MAAKVYVAVPGGEGVQLPQQVVGGGAVQVDGQQSIVWLHTLRRPVSDDEQIIRAVVAVLGKGLRINACGTEICRVLSSSRNGIRHDFRLFGMRLCHSPLFPGMRLRCNFRLSGNRIRRDFRLSRIRIRHNLQLPGEIPGLVPDPLLQVQQVFPFL